MCTLQQSVEKKQLQTLYTHVVNKDSFKLRSNLRVAQNERFVINPIHPGKGTMVAKISDFRLFSGPFLSQITPTKLNFALLSQELS